VRRHRHRLVASFVAAAVVALASVTGASAGTRSWSQQANGVCTVWLAKLKQAFATPVTAAQLYPFAVHVKGMESSELAQLQQIPGRDAAGSAALAAVRVDIAELGSAIAAWKQGDPTRFVTIFKRYLNDERPKSAFAVAGATACG
jgi:hypothetical protein